MTKRAKAVALVRLFDARDIHTYSGLLLTTAGLWFAIGPPALAVIGLGLFYLGTRRA